MSDDDQGNVLKLRPDVKVPTGQPNEGLVTTLRNMLAMAESGELQSFIGCGFTTDRGRLAVWSDNHPDVFAMLGSIAWLQAEYIHRHTQ